jgi:apolipoprotein N-acyltransferase
MRSITLRAWLLTIVSGVLQILLFPIAGPAPRALGGLAWIALVPLLIALLYAGPGQSALSPRHAALLGYLCGVIWYAGNCYWIYQTMYLYGGLPKPVALGILFLFALYLGLYHALFSWFVVCVAQSRMAVGGALLLAPFAWVVVELARSRITGFPWDLLGYSQIDNLLLTRLAPFAGVMSIGFVLMCVNAGLASVVVLKGRPRFAIAATALLMAAGLELGGSLEGVPEHGSLSHFAVMLQENLEVGAVGRAIRPLSEREELPLFSAMTEHPGL